ncbi:polysaccharide biosynthesis C-terminal domain-containing protein [Dyadobacter sp. CY323]|uniref:polysaccharide biosynthesis C-terminal domain-containing protein n=1 Tax=Dyadobacter sp. CY323 TaxID=2907302 RepID=UPI001F470172|nr:polysaccharide biosynthesis C-terminal domain-containing protein [Dyadobacter sp. CY323]MCE6992727.1 polysaccharide biosynthesis C-terminal domain-containing protein [Dyadobacter sp. CY323]
MGIIVRQSLKAGLGSYIGVGVGIINQMYVSTKFLSVEQLAVSRLLFENSLLFAAFAHLGTPFIADKFFSLFRDDKEGHHGILPFLLFLPLIGGLLFSGLYLASSGLIRAYYMERSPMLTNYHFLVIPLTIFWLYIAVLESYCRNNSRIAIPNFIREVYLRFANMILILIFGLGWLSFDLMLYLVIISYGFGVVFLIFYIKKLGKWYWRFPDRSILTNGLFKQMLAYGSFTLLGGIGVNLMLFIDRSMLAGERGLIQTGIFIIAAYIAGVIEIPRKAIAQISIPLLTTSLLNKDYDHIRMINRKSALNQLIAGGLFFALIWISIDEIFYLIPKGETYSEGKMVVLFLALAKVFDIATGLNLEIILYSKYYRYATMFIITSAVIGFCLNLWLIPLYGFTGAAIATAMTTLIYSVSRMTFVWRKFQVQPFSLKTLQVFLILVGMYALTLLMPDYQMTTFSAMATLAIRSAIFALVFAFLVLKYELSPELNELATGLRKKVFRS